MQLRLDTKQNHEVIDITDEISGQVPDGSGVMHVFVQHTTCAITTMDVDTGMDNNLLTALANLISPQRWQHPHNNAHEHVIAHLLGSILGPSLAIPYQDGQLQLGTWQRIVLVELDGPRERRLTISTTPVAM